MFSLELGFVKGIILQLSERFFTSLMHFQPETTSLILQCNLRLSIIAIYDFIILMS